MNRDGNAPGAQFGSQSMTAPLRRVLVVAPRAEEAQRWRESGWRSAPDPGRLAAEHAAFRAELEASGAEVVVAETSSESGLDGVYPYDPVLVVNGGALLLRPGKDSRLGEVEPLGQALEAAGVPTVSRVEAPATVDGGDTCWLDDRTLLVGLGYRTNEAGAAALRDTLPDVDVLTFDLPHHRGHAELLHLMSVISPLADDLAVVYLPLLPVRLVQLLAARGLELIEVPDDEFATQGPNVLALAPRVALALDGNPETRRRMEAAGVDVRVYRGDELSHKGEGGPTCLTRPILRA
jgi:N-dimethylarginine dimethylaminohydrolase